MNIKAKFAFVAAMIAMGSAAPATAHAAQRHYAAAHGNTFCYCGDNYRTLYNYVPVQVERPDWLSAAALGNSH